MPTVRRKEAASSNEAATPSVDRDAGPRSLARLLGIFDVLAESRSGMSLAELAIALGSPKSSLLNLLRPLVSDGFLVHADGCYRVGPAMFRLASHVLSAWNFPKLIRPFMEELAVRTEETVLLSVLNREAEVMTYVEIIPSPRPIRYQIAVGTTRPIYANTAGRLLLAFSDKKWRDGYIASVDFKSKLAVPITRASLKREVEQIRQDGVCAAIDSYAKGLAAVAAPLFDADGNCVAALNIAGPSERFRSELDGLIAAVTEVAAKASGNVPAMLER